MPFVKLNFWPSILKFSVKFKCTFEYLKIILSILGTFLYRSYFHCALKMH